MVTRAWIPPAALAFLMPAVLGPWLRAGDLPPPRRWIEPPQIDALPPALPPQALRERDSLLSLPHGAPPRRAGQSDLPIPWP